MECKGKGAIGSKRFIGCDGVLAGGLAHLCSLLCCAGNYVSDSEAAMAWIKQKLEHNKRMLCTLCHFSFTCGTLELTTHHTYRLC